MAKQVTTGKRYTEDQKKKILAFVESFEKGGMSRAQEKFNVSYLTIRSWMNPKDKSKKTLVKAAKPVKATKKAAKQEKNPDDLLISLQALKDQVAQLSVRLSKLEVPKATKAKSKPVSEAAPLVTAIPAPVEPEAAKPSETSIPSPSKEAPIEIQLTPELATA